MSDDSKLRSGARGLTAGRLLNSGVSDFISSRSPGDRAPGAAGRSWSWSRSSQHEQIVGDDAQPDPPLHSARTSVPAPPQPVATLEHTDAPFTAGAPAERRAGGARALRARLARQHDVPDPRSCAARSLVREAKPPSATASCGARPKSAMCRSRAGARGMRSAWPFSHTS
jgi:hypothetical protein